MTPNHIENKKKHILIASQAKVDAILKGEMDPSACCSYGTCRGDVVISVG